jgi:peptidoglycan/LPS O-acetylase OafA/YrhL
MALVVVLVVASFLFNVHGIAHDKAATFYAPWCRFWEILSGGVLAYLHRGTRPDGWWACFTVRARTELPFTPVITAMQARNVCACLGLVILLVGFFSLNRQTPFPGWFALIPVGGALLLIGSGPSAWVNRRLLSHPAIVWFGLISYPLYLWHWVLLSYTRIIEGGEPSTLIKTGAIAISILASWATFQLIENPIRFGQFRRPQTA